MATSKIKKGDTVRVIAGVDKGKEGKVLAVKDGKVKVEGINKVKMHIKPNQSNAKGGIVEESFFFNDSALCILSLTSQMQRAESLKKKLSSMFPT